MEYSHFMIYSLKTPPTQKKQKKQNRFAFFEQLSLIFIGLNFLDICSLEVLLHLT